jgi:hypothetical protein
MSERFPHLYDGAVAIGAALGTNDKKDFYTFQYNPQYPIIFLTNLSETGVIEDYIEKCDKKNDPTIITPALWTISREGHNLVTEDERYNAINHLAYWIKFQTFITCRYTDRTIFRSFSCFQLTSKNTQSLPSSLMISNLKEKEQFNLYPSSEALKLIFKNQT